MSSSKIFILVLVLVVVVFVVGTGLGLGGCNDREPGGGQPGWTKATTRWFLNEEDTKLPLADFRTLPSRKPLSSRTLVVPPGAQGSQFLITGDAPQLVRSVKLELTGWRLNNVPFAAPKTSKVTVDWKPAGGGPALNVPLSAAGPLTLQATKEGGTLAIQNANPAEAVIELR
jgi:hypothetical protein